VVSGNPQVPLRPLTAIMIVIMSLLDEVPIMNIAYDNTPVSEKPIRWQMSRLLGVAGVLGLFSVVESFGLLLVVIAILLTQTVAALMCGFGWLVSSINWSLVGWVWLYDIVWMCALGGVRLLAERFAAYRTVRQAKTRARRGLGWNDRWSANS